MVNCLRLADAAMQDQQFLAGLLFEAVEELPEKAKWVVQLCMDNASVNLAAASIFCTRYMLCISVTCMILMSKTCAAS